jgi:hypothetical protein
MNRIAVGTACVAVLLFSAIKLTSRRRTLVIFALEQAERLFDMMENVRDRLEKSSVYRDLENSEAKKRRDRSLARVS